MVEISAKEMDSIKAGLYQYCLQYVDERIETAQRAIKDAQEASQNDTKSSAGDKYETGRAMAQQEIDRNQGQLIESAKLRQILERINPETSYKMVQPGSVAVTDKGKFYLAISAGQIIHNEEIFFAVSAASPIGSKLIGKKTGDELDFNGKKYKILNVY